MAVLGARPPCFEAKPAWKQRVATRHGRVRAVAVSLPSTRSIRTEQGLASEGTVVQDLPEDFLSGASAVEVAKAMPWDGEDMPWLACQASNPSHSFDLQEPVTQRSTATASHTLQPQPPGEPVDIQAGVVSEPSQSVPKKRGRSKSKQPASTAEVHQQSITLDTMPLQPAAPQQRQRRRSKSMPVSSTDQQLAASVAQEAAQHSSSDAGQQAVSSASPSTSQPSPPAPVKSRRGRPRKHPISPSTQAPSSTASSTDQTGPDIDLSHLEFVPSHKIKQTVQGSRRARSVSPRPAADLGLATASAAPSSRARSRTPSHSDAHRHATPGLTVQQSMDAALSQLSNPLGVIKTHAGSKVLTREEEKELALQCQDFIGLEVMISRLGRILKRPPTEEEAARALKMTPGALRARLAAGVSAKRALVQYNKGLVAKSVNTMHKALEMTGKTMSKADLMEEGIKGLLSAIRKFDPHAGFKLSTYASIWIKQSVQRAVQDQASLVRLTGKASEDAQRLNRVQKHLIQVLRREPTVAELARELEWPPLRVQRTLDSIQVSFSSDGARSIESSMEEDDGTSLGEMLAAGTRQGDDNTMAVMGGTSGTLEESWMAQDITALIDEAIRKVVRDPVKAQLAAQMLHMRLGLTPLTGSPGGGMVDGVPDQVAGALTSAPTDPHFAAHTLREVGDACGVSYESVRQLERKVLSLLRSKYGEDLSEIIQGYDQLDSEARMAPRSAPGAHKKS